MPSTTVRRGNLNRTTTKARGIKSVIGAQSRKAPLTARQQRLTRPGNRLTTNRPTAKPVSARARAAQKGGKGGKSGS